MVTVAAMYGAVVGRSMPQFSRADSVPGELSARYVQSMAAFGLVRLATLYMGLSALGHVKDAFTRTVPRFPYARTVFMGVLIGAF